MRKAEFKEIDGYKYRCDMMPVRRAQRTWIDLLSTLGGPAIEAIASGMDNEEQDAIALLTASISVIAQKLEGTVSERLIEAVFEGVSTTEGEGEDILELKPWDAKFESHFHGRLLTLYKVWAWAVQVNYSDFLDAAQSLGLDQSLKLGKQALLSHLTPTSESGVSSQQSSTT